MESRFACLFVFLVGKGPPASRLFYGGTLQYYAYFPAEALSYLLILLICHYWKSMKVSVEMCSNTFGILKD